MRPPHVTIRGTLLIALWALAVGCSGSEGVPRSESIALHAHPGDCRQCHGALPVGGPRSPPPPWHCAASGCHRILEPAPRLVHGPVATGDCLACHLPHSSVAPHLVAAPAPRLCAGCHGRLYTCPAAADPAADCLSCHEPHGGGRGFLRPLAAARASPVPQGLNVTPEGELNTENTEIPHGESRRRGEQRKREGQKE